MANILTPPTLVLGTTLPDGRLCRVVRNFRRLRPIDRLLAASTVTVVAITILVATWAVASIRQQLASPSPRLSGYLAGANK